MKTTIKTTDDIRPTITEIRDHVLAVLERRGLQHPPPDPGERVRMIMASVATTTDHWLSFTIDLRLTYSEYRDGRKRLGVGREHEDQSQLAHMLLGVEWVADEPPAIVEDCDLVAGAWIDEVMALSLTPAGDFAGVLGLPVPNGASPDWRNEAFE